MPSSKKSPQSAAPLVVIAAETPKAPAPAAKPKPKPVIKTPVKAPAKPVVKAAAPVAAEVKPAVKPATKAVVKPAAKPAVKPVAKPVAKLAEKPAPKAAAKVAVAAPTAKVAEKVAEKPETKAVVKPEKPAKPKQAKLIRDSFTMPESEYDLMAAVKKRCLAAGVAVKKSEVLRAAIIGFAAQSDAAITAALQSLVVIKTGRPPKGQK